MGHDKVPWSLLQTTGSFYNTCILLVLKHRVTAISWSEIQPDLVVSGDDNGLLGVWQVEDNRQAAHRLDKTGITALAMAPFSAGLTAVG
ncbi:hypothetical protein DPMN_100802 [Dreissena polymorpha]|uniref:Uncharacterized protein n=1 Tax=Dreissena polymorpha TaxID=45954 RepID=A0A9D4R902_DREPO|nr:hypothetical protein DPMN_100802 [Dreissena polymorpha]